MNPIIERRFKENVGDWDFTTVINGQVVRTPDYTDVPKDAPAQPSLVSTEELVKMLGEQNKEVIPVVAKEKAGGEVIFNGLKDFNTWYLIHREEFAAEQREALNTLVGIEDLVTKGCKCNEAERDKQAHAYYQDFFLINHERKNDLIPSIKKIGGFEKISFVNSYSGDETPFLVA